MLVVTTTRYSGLPICIYRQIIYDQRMNAEELNKILEVCRKHRVSRMDLKDEKTALSFDLIPEREDSKDTTLTPTRYDDLLFYSAGGPPKRRDHDG